MDTIYGHFDDLQIEEYKEKLHKEMFWLLLYKDPKTKDEFKNVDFEKYFINLMKKIDGLNTLLFYPVEIVAIMSLLQAALNETRSNDEGNILIIRRSRESTLPRSILYILLMNVP